MKQNKYDDPNFFSEYKKMARSVKGLEAAGEWPAFRALLPELQNKTVLDLGCGFGWHCRFAREQHASKVVGVDLSEKMLQTAREKTDDSAIIYLQMPIEDSNFPNASFDVVISSLAFHYIESFEPICKRVYDCLKPGGTFVFSVEHPIFTASAEQEWYLDEQGNRLHWPVDHYHTEGLRETTFLDEAVNKYHRTLSTYLNDVIEAGFTIEAVKESKPTDEMLEKDPAMKDEDRRPMFLLVSATKA